MSVLLSFVTVTLPAEYRPTAWGDALGEMRAVVLHIAKHDFCRVVSPLSPRPGSNGMSPWRQKSNRVVDTSTSVMLHDPHLVEMSAQLK